VEGNVDATQTDHREIDFPRVLLTSGDQDISSHIHFTNLEFTAPIFLGMLNGLNFKSLFSRVVTNDYAYPITGMLTINGNFDAQNLHITSWNGRRFPNDFISLSESHLVVGKQKTFSHLRTQDVSNNIFSLYASILVPTEIYFLVYSLLLTDRLLLISSWTTN